MEELNNNGYKRFNILEPDVEELIRKANVLINKEIRSIELQKSNPSIKLGKYVDRLLSHNKNREFYNKTNISAKEVLELASLITTKHFCHYEIDSARRNEKMYCFKLPSNINGEDFESDILVKFKFRPKEDVPGQLFLMSFHFPDSNKEPWKYLYNDE